MSLITLKVVVERRTIGNLRIGAGKERLHYGNTILRLSRRKISQSNDSSYITVELRPFKHQVGGHTCVLEVSSSVICKPYKDMEVWFYEHELDFMKDFTPKYLGEIEVACDITQEKKCPIGKVPKAIAEK